MTISPPLGSVVVVDVVVVDVVVDDGTVVDDVVDVVVGTVVDDVVDVVVDEVVVLVVVDVVVVVVGSGPREMTTVTAPGGFAISVPSIGSCSKTKLGVELLYASVLPP